MTLEIRRTVRWGEEDDPTDIVPPFEVTVIVDEDNFTIQDVNGRWIFRAPLELLMVQLCYMEPKLAQWVISPTGPPRTMTVHLPRRGDDVEAWLVTQRDTWNRTGERPEFRAIDGMLDRYRECADYGVALDGERGYP